MATAGWSMPASACRATNLGGEVDILQRLILAPAANDVGQGWEGILVAGSRVGRLLCGLDDNHGHNQSQHAVDKDKKLRVFEHDIVAVLVRAI